MAQNQIGRTVFLSSVGAEMRSGAGEIDGLARTEEQLDATGATVLHLRGGYFFTNLLGDLASLREGVLAAPMATDHALPWVDPRDIGDVAAGPRPGPGRARHRHHNAHHARRLGARRPATRADPGARGSLGGDCLASDPASPGPCEVLGRLVLGPAGLGFGQPGEAAQGVGQGGPAQRIHRPAARRDGSGHDQVEPLGPAELAVLPARDDLEEAGAPDDLPGVPDGAKPPPLRWVEP